MYRSTRKTNWSMLVDDISRQIVENLLFSIHHCRFAAVCKNWHRIAMESLCPFQQNSLFVLIPHNDKMELGKCSLYLVSDSKTFEFNVPELRGKYIHSSSKGWLAVANHDFELSLINFLTRTHIKLPEPSYALEVFEDDYFEPDMKYNPSGRCYVMKKFVTSESPSSSSSCNGCIVAAIMSCYDKLFFCRLRDDSWTRIQLAKRSKYCYDPCDHLQDLIFFGGKLYAIGSTIVQVDFDGPNFEARTMRRPYIKHTDLGELDVLKVYLVECSGNLLYVSKIGEITCDGMHHKTRGFQVYKLEKDGATWSRVYELGEHSLFLGGNESMAVSAGVISWCRPNCIYYVDDVWGGEGFQGDNGVFSFEDGRFEMFNISHTVACRVSPSMWCQQKK